ncbi:MAG TPA: hypothetical protein VGK30_01060 [Candidatus Binatia bacterium]
MASKDASPSADATLRAAGVADDVTAPAELLAHAGRAPDLDLAIVARLGGTPGAEGAAVLRSIETAAERLGWKAVAKEARRVLYRFAQRGVAVPPPAPAEEQPRLRAPSPVEGRVSAIDGRGDRLVWIVRARHDGGLAVLTAILNEPGGLRDVALAEMPRKQLRRMEQDLHSRHRLRMVTADAAYCDALLEEGFARARAAGTQGVGEYPAFRARLFSTEPAPRDPPLAARVLGGDVASAVTDGPALLAEPEFLTWLLDRSVLGPYAAEVNAARESPLVLSRPQQEERGRAIIARALRELFAGEAGLPYRRRLEEMAYFLHATGRPALARAALASAEALGASPTGGEGVPFFEELTRRSFALLLQEDATRARVESESSLLVRPGAATQPPRRPR